jgi:hypothetical protein
MNVGLYIYGITVSDGLNTGICGCSEDLSHENVKFYKPGTKL